MLVQLDPEGEKHNYILAAILALAVVAWARRFIRRPHIGERHILARGPGRCAPGRASAPTVADSTVFVSTVARWPRVSRPRRRKSMSGRRTFPTRSLGALGARAAGLSTAGALPPDKGNVRAITLYTLGTGWKPLFDDNHPQRYARQPAQHIPQIAPSSLPLHGGQWALRSQPVPSQHAVGDKDPE